AVGRGQYALSEEVGLVSFRVVEGHSQGIGAHDALARGAGADRNPGDQLIPRLDDRLIRTARKITNLATLAVKAHGPSTGFLQGGADDGGGAQNRKEAAAV